jgi:hypothetical protein
MIRNFDTIRRQWFEAKWFRVTPVSTTLNYIIQRSQIATVNAFQHGYLIQPLDDNLQPTSEQFTGDGVIRLGLDKVLDGSDIPLPLPPEKPTPVKPSQIAIARDFVSRLTQESKEVPICVLMPSGAFMGVSEDGTKLQRWDNIQVQLVADRLGVAPTEKVGSQFWVFARRILEDQAKHITMVTQASTGVPKGLGTMGEDFDNNPVYVWRN